MVSALIKEHGGEGVSIIGDGEVSLNANDIRNNIQSRLVELNTNVACDNCALLKNIGINDIGADGDFVFIGMQTETGNLARGCNSAHESEHRESEHDLTATTTESGVRA